MNVYIYIYTYVYIYTYIYLKAYVLPPTLNWSLASTVSILKAAWHAWPWWLDCRYVQGLIRTWEVLQVSLICLIGYSHFGTFGGLPIGHFHDLKVSMILKASFESWLVSRVSVSGSMCQIISVMLCGYYFQVVISKGVSNIGLFQNESWFPSRLVLVSHAER